MEDRYINQIGVVKTKNWLVELVDKLNLAPVEHYAHIHALPEKDDDEKIYSNIGITMIDYSGGTGDNSVIVNANISPDDIIFIYSRITAGFQDYLFRETKIFGQPDASGKCPATKVFIKRTPADANGTPMDNPWQFSVQNGVGIKLTNQLGGSYMKGKSWELQREVQGQMTDKDAHSLFSRAVSYIKAWELSYGPAVIREGRTKQHQIVASRRAARQAAQQTAR